MKDEENLSYLFHASINSYISHLAARLPNIIYLPLECLEKAPTAAKVEDPNATDLILSKLFRYSPQQNIIVSPAEVI